MPRGTGSGGSGSQTAVRFSGGKQYWGDVITSSGAVITCPLGKRIQVVYVTFTPDSDATTTNLVKVHFEDDANNLYCAYAAGHWEVFTGQTDKDLIFTLENSNPVAATVHYSIIR